jgi:multidrug efflux pump subunit AcrA (membrane-fusion protein)
MHDRRAQIQQILIWVLVVIAGIGMTIFIVPPWREAVVNVVRRPEQPAAKAPKSEPVELIQDPEGRYGLRIAKVAWDNLEVSPIEVPRATHSRPMPPQIGTVNYDNDYIYEIRPRFPGEIVRFHQVKENLYPEGPPRERDISFADKIKQGQVLAEFWSKDLGLAKAALVDAIVNKTKSDIDLKKQQALYAQGATPEAALRAAEKQLQNDISTYRSALYPLYVWKVPRSEIQEVEREAASILKDLTKPRDPEEEIKRWARVEVKAPVFALGENGKPDPNRELIVLEKNITANSFIDPGRDTPLFRLADLTRLQIWIHPPEEYLPMLREHLERKGPDVDPNSRGLRLLARFQADALTTPPMELTISRIAPSIDPTLRTPMLIAELKNVDRKYLVGQFVNTIIELPPLPDTVEVPTDAINLVENQNLVFVRPNGGKDNEYFLRRVAVAQTAGNMTLVRSKLTEADRQQSEAELKVNNNRRPIETIQPGDWVLTRGVVELTAKIEDLIPPAPAVKHNPK